MLACGRPDRCRQDDGKPAQAGRPGSTAAAHHVAVTPDWSSPRLRCVAGDFSKYDLYAVGQMQRNIELIRYAKYGDDLLALGLINRTLAPASSSGSNAMGAVSNLVPKPVVSKSVSDYLAQADTVLTDRFDALKAMILELGDDVETKTLKLYFAFRRLKNFDFVEVHPQLRELVGYVKHPAPPSVEEKGFARDVTAIGHFGPGNLELTLKTKLHIGKARHLIESSYETNLRSWTNTSESRPLKELAKRQARTPVCSRSENDMHCQRRPREAGRIQPRLDAGLAGNVHAHAHANQDVLV